ncbi:MAG: AraC family transcriptional regulator [Bacteroidales bacterium]|nr:AraC family transcriptional regulator [Bacteroidales bacterium]
MSSTHLSNQRQKEILLGFIELMDDKKVYLMPGINLNIIAEMIETNRQYLSQTINNYYHQNFNQIINTLRIRDAKLLLIEDKFEKYTIESIAESVGFKNRTSFISAFKKVCGKTPSEFRKEMADSNAKMENENY